ncbi:MAG: HlyD family secretion protein [Flavobacterium sp.]
MPDKLPSSNSPLPASAPELPASNPQLPSSAPELPSSNSPLPSSASPLPSSASPRPAPHSQLPTPNLELRSEEVQDILTKMPHGIIRWGSLVFLLILCALFFISWMIKYPDIVTTEVFITTEVPPEKIIARSSGKIEAILIADRSIVAPNTPLAVIENSASFKDVFLLKSITDTIDIEKSTFPFELFRTVQLGEVESSFALFQKEYIASQLNNEMLPFLVEKNAQKLELNQLKERLAILISQKELNQNELMLLSSDVERYKKLFEKDVIASQEMDKQKLNFIQAEKNYKNLLSSISQLKSTINELNKQSLTTDINENTTNINLERSVYQSFYQLKKAIRDWELNYVLRSSIGGTVSFLDVWVKNQTITAGDTIFAMIPIEKGAYIAKLKAPAQNAGKIKEQQSVNIRLANYPDREYGILKGKINRISLTPDKEGNLLIDVSLPEGIVTSYNKEIIFQQEMSGTADIVTEDLRLIERLLYQFRDIFTRNKPKEKKENA